MAKTMASLQAFPSSLLPRAWSRALIPFPFPFERLPLRLVKIEQRRRNNEEQCKEKQKASCRLCHQLGYITKTV